MNEISLFEISVFEIMFWRSKYANLFGTELVQRCKLRLPF